MGRNPTMPLARNPADLGRARIVRVCDDRSKACVGEVAGQKLHSIFRILRSRLDLAPVSYQQSEGCKYSTGRSKMLSQRKYPIRDAKNGASMRECQCSLETLDCLRALLLALKRFVSDDTAAPPTVGSRDEFALLVIAARRLLEQLQEHAAADAVVSNTLPEGLFSLTSRQFKVLQLVAEGYANKQIAAELGISIKTVEKHRQQVMAKLNIHETAGLTRFAIDAGVIGSRFQPGYCPWHAKDSCPVFAAAGRRQTDGLEWTPA